MSRRLLPSWWRGRLQRTFERSVFYQDGEEIAWHKMTLKGEIYEQTGEIPDGKVKFINETDQTYGVEYYRDGLRNGPMRVNYKDGALKQEAYFVYGKLMTNKEFYTDGTLKMDEDYNDARDYRDGREVGDGKVYARDGKVKYEWHLTNSDPVGFHKSYDRQGRLTSAVHYDQFGQIIEPAQATGAAVSAAPAPSL